MVAAIVSAQMQRFRQYWVPCGHLWCIFIQGCYIPLVYQIEKMLFLLRLLGLYFQT
jgi:hypothetical protein